MVASGILSEDERAIPLDGVIHIENADGGFVPRLFTRNEYYAMARGWHHRLTTSDCS